MLFKSKPKYILHKNILKFNKSVLLYINCIKLNLKVNTLLNYYLSYFKSIHFKMSHLNLFVLTIDYFLANNHVNLDIPL